MTTRYICWSVFDDDGNELTDEDDALDCLCEVDSSSECSIIAGGWPWQKCHQLEIREREQADDED